MAFPDAFLDEITAKTDMIALVSQYTQPARRGTRWFARCPFHSEKTPSFTVTPENGLFYCFGCQAGGGPIQFVMRAENLEFADAVRVLAERSGLAVPEDDDPGIRIRRERLLEINRMAARWFYEMLGSEEGKPCAEYMRSRGMRPDMARRFGLGYAPARWEGLIAALTAQGVSIDELAVAGLASRNKRGGMNDAFYDRLIFPIFDLRGQVAGFSGRALGDGMPKYKNSAESPVYQKRNLLYGAHIARKSERPYWILTEGNIDVFMLHQAGFDNTVATCGTALTDTQARLVARHVRELALAYDNDEAGLKATQKAVRLSEAAGVRVRVLHLRGAKDPDDFIRVHGADGFEKLLAGSQNHIEYRLSLLESQSQIGSDAGKMEFLRGATQLLAELPSRGEREIYAARVAAKLGIDSKAVSRDVETVSRKRGKAAEKSYEAKLIRPGLRDIATAGQAAAETALALLLRFPELETSLTAEDFETEAHKLLFINRLSPLSGDAAPLYAALMARYEELPNAPAALRDCEERLKYKDTPDLMEKFNKYRVLKTKEGGQP
jgi:DNA primase